MEWLETYQSMPRMNAPKLKTTGTAAEKRILQSDMLVQEEKTEC